MSVTMHTWVSPRRAACRKQQKDGIKLSSLLRLNPGGSRNGHGGVKGANTGDHKAKRRGRCVAEHDGHASRRGGGCGRLEAKESQAGLCRVQCSMWGWSIFNSIQCDQLTVQYEMFNVQFNVQCADQPKTFNIHISVQCQGPKTPEARQTVEVSGTR